MIDLTTMLPLARETPETIKARLLADSNVGIDPADPTYLDLLAGSFGDDMHGAVALELDRLYDRATSEVPAAALPATSSGEWLDAWATTVRLERKAATAASGVVEFTAPEGTAVPTGTQVSTVQTSADSDPITFQTTEGGVVDISGVLALPVQAVRPGADTNVAANTVTVLESSLEDAAAVTNPLALTAGSDIETDESLADRIGERLSGAGGGGNVDWYRSETLNVPGVGFVTVFPNTPDVGHVTLRITDINNDPAPAGLITTVKTKFDPSDDEGQGAGQAPPGATVHVETPAHTDATIDATVRLASGYSLDGAGGTRALRDDITTAITRYVNSLPVGADVVLNKVLAAIIDVDGVEDVTVLTINAVAADLAIDDTHVAVLVMPVTLAEA